MAKAEGQYKEYFELLDKAERSERDREAESQAEKKRKELPIQVAY